MSRKTVVLDGFLSSRIVILLLVIVFISATVAVSTIPQQGDFIEIIGLYSVAFISYFALALRSKITLRDIFLIGVLARVILVFLFPNLSDDLYRFIWDGKLISEHINPYSMLPSAYDGASSFMTFLFDEMNSPEYFTIYPPFTQLVFYVSALSGEDILLCSKVLKTIFVIAEMGTFFFMVKTLGSLSKRQSLSAIYFLNPLVLLEGLGNLHFEILMIFFLSATIYFYFVKKKVFIAIVFFMLSVASKLLPLMFLPYFLFKEKKENIIKILGIGIPLFVLIFSPVVIGVDFKNFFASIDLYFQKFEFNASIYYVLRYFGRILSGYNLIHYIGPLLGVLTVGFIFNKARKADSLSLSSFIKFALFSFSIYLFFATTVHPWYLMVPTFLSVFVEFRYVLLWSYLIFLSYIHYSYDPVSENFAIIALEYGIVFGYIAIFERRAIFNHEIKSLYPER